MDKLLYGKDCLPIAAARVTADCPAAKKSEEWGFGLSGEKVSATLRALADKIDGGKIAAQRFDTGRRTSLEEFEIQTVTFEYAERVRGEQS